MKLILHNVEHGREGSGLEIVKISEAEYEIMKIIWKEDDEVTTAKIIEELGEDNLWKHTTILTLAKRLVDKNVLRVRKKGKINYYFPTISKDEYKSYQAMIYRDIGGSVKSLVASVQNKKIGEEDIKELKDWIRRV